MGSWALCEYVQVDSPTPGNGSQLWHPQVPCLQRPLHFETNVLMLKKNTHQKTWPTIFVECSILGISLCESPSIWCGFHLERLILQNKILQEIRDMKMVVCFLFYFE